MGLEENLEKLKKELEKDITEECQIFCIMARIRKALEQENLQNKFPVLNFYCNWTLHPQIENTEAIREILEKIAETIKSKKYDPFTLLAFVDFEEFRKETSLFLEKSNIPNACFRDYDKWENFRRLFVNILIDSPLYPKFGEVEYWILKGPISYNSEINFEIKLRDIVLPYKSGFSFVKPV